jgi:hypothetical protein
MANEKDIKEAILKVAGNPESGAIHSLAPEMAKAIMALDELKSPRAEKPKREVRVTEPTEVR